MFCHGSCIESMPAEWSVPVIRMETDGTVNEQALSALLAAPTENAAPQPHAVAPASGPADANTGNRPVERAVLALNR